MKNKRIPIILITLILLISITGCTNKDRVEINKREYIFAVGIDKSEKNDSEYTFTAEIPIISSGSENERFVLTKNSKNLTDFYYDNVLSTDKIASDSLMQVIVIGEDVVKNKDNVKRLFDEIERSPEINRKVKIVIAKDKASDIINFEIKDNPLVGRYISEFLVKLKKLSYQTTYSFDEVALYLQSMGNALIPSIEIKDNRVSIDGAAVIRDYSLIDYINNYENGLISMLTKGASTGMKDVNVELDQIPISLSFDNVIVSQNIDLNEKNLSANFYVTAYCNIDAYDITKFNSSEEEFLRRLSNEVNRKLTKDTNELIKKMQKTYKMDMLNIQEDLIKFNKTRYDVIKDSYSEVFESAKIVVNYNVKINNSGMVK